MRELKSEEAVMVAGGGLLEKFGDAVSAGFKEAGKTGSASAGWAEFKRVINK